MIKNREIDMTNGSILNKLIKCSIPLIFINLIQTFFHATDVLMLSIIKNDSNGVAAVGETTPLINIIIGLFVGLSMGANVLVAQSKGKKDVEDTQKIIGMSMMVSVIAGFIVMLIGILCAKTLLNLMGCPVEILSSAEKYLIIYFLGMPIMLVYNFCASIMRASGDNVRPLIFLIIGGIINIVGNYIFITVFNLTVEGVALASVISQLISAILCIVVMLKTDGICKLRVSRIRFYKRKFKELMVIGIPMGVQSVLFGLSNVFIVSSVSSFGKDAVAGYTISQQFLSIIYTTCNAISLAVLTFVSQNYGARKIDRIKKTKRQGLLFVAITGIILGLIIFLLSNLLFPFVTNEEMVKKFAQTSIIYLALTYFLCGIMEVESQLTRGMGKSTTAMFISLVGNCVLRIVWLKIFPFVWWTIDMVYLSYPISWILTILVYEITHIKLFKAEDNKENILEVANKTKI